MNIQALFGHPFTAEFHGNAIYMDTEYDMLNLTFAGTTEVSAKDRAGDQRSIEYVNAIVSMEISKALTELANKKVPFKTLQQHMNELNEAGAAALRAQGFTVTQFAVRSVEPTESCRKIMALKDQQKTLAAMSPEQLQKRVEEAQRQAQEAIAKLSPEEQQKINNEALAQIEAMKRAAGPNGANAAIAGQAPLTAGNMRADASAPIRPNHPTIPSGTQEASAPIRPNHPVIPSGIASEAKALIRPNHPTIPSGNASVGNAPASNLSAGNGQDMSNHMKPAGGSTLTPNHTDTAATAPKFCPNCGTATDGSRFCGACGTRLI
ncbi:MAG: hypothetical protein J5649_10595 [Lachnospiraceae bacterium]|nr:hypothetical protein [Lachnospiraceae bacterium]